MTRTESAPKSPMPVGSLGPREFEFLWSAHQRLFNHVASVNRMWLESVREATESSSQLTAKLTSCTNPAEAGVVCGEWLRDRGQRFLADSRRATEMWTSFCGTLPVSGAEPSAKAADEEPSGATDRRAAA